MSRRRKHDLTGKHFGRLEVLWRSISADKAPRWHCQCDCGNRKDILQSNLLKGRAKGCGCLSNNPRGRPISATSTKAERAVWRNMLERCYEPAAIGYPDYGARGITVCARWRNSFENFLADMGHRPSPQHSIDREKSDGNYEPSNCRWATQKVQLRNKRDTLRKTMHAQRQEQFSKPPAQHKTQSLHRKPPRRSSWRRRTKQPT